MAEATLEALLVEDPVGEPLSPCQLMGAAMSELESLVAQDAALVVAKTKEQRKRNAFGEILAQEKAAFRLREDAEELGIQSCSYPKNH